MQRNFNQISNLPPHVSGAPARVITVASGKGGVGKSTVTVNLAVALQARGQKVVLLDADMGLANLDVLLGLQPRFHLGHVLDGKCELAESLVDGPLGIKIVPSASGNTRLADLGPTEQAGLIHAFSDLDVPFDTLLIDSAAGIAGNVLTFAQAAHDVIVVVCDEPASITDAYALVKVLSQERRVERFQVVANMTRRKGQGKQLFDKLLRVTDRFLNVNMQYLGEVPYDERLLQAIQSQRSVIEAWPGSDAAKSFGHLAELVSRWSSQPRPRGHLEFFVDRMVAPDMARAS